MAYPPTLYKVLIEADGRVRSLYRDFTEYLPKNGKAGAWLPVITQNPKVSAEGYHLTSDPEAHGLPGDQIFVAEGAGRFDVLGDQWTFQTMRLVRHADH